MIIEVSRRGDERFAVIDGIEGMPAFQEATKNRILHKGAMKGILRLFAALPMSGKSTAAEQDTEKWNQDETINEELANLGLPPLSNIHSKMDWSLYAARERAGVLGMDYDIQSQDYILEASSYHMITQILWVVSNARRPWKMNVEAVLAPYPLRNYMWTAFKLLADSESIRDFVDIEFIGFTPDQPLYENALREREEKRLELIRLGQAGAPPEIVSWIDIHTEVVIDKLIRTGQLPDVSENYRNNYEDKAYAIRRLLGIYSQDLLGEQSQTRSLIEINRLRSNCYRPNPKAFKEKYSAPISEISVAIFGQTGLGAFKPDTDEYKDRVKSGTPGIQWLSERVKDPFKDTQIKGPYTERLPWYNPDQPPLPK